MVSVFKPTALFRAKCKPIFIYKMSPRQYRYIPAKSTDDPPSCRVGTVKVRGVGPLGGLGATEVPGEEDAGLKEARRHNKSVNTMGISSFGADYMTSLGIT